MRGGRARSIARAASIGSIALLGAACATPRYTPPPVVAEADRQACDQFAQSEASAVFHDTRGEVKRILADSTRFPPLLLLAPITLPLAALSNHDNDAKHQALYEAAMKTCVAPVVLAYTLGPGHPDVARSLDRLAQLYAFRGRQTEAEALYQRALTIQEHAPGPTHPDLAQTLEHYATLLRAMGREPEAVNLEHRANAIRAAAGQRPPP